MKKKHDLATLIEHISQFSPGNFILENSEKDNVWYCTTWRKRNRKDPYWRRIDVCVSSSGKTPQEAVENLYEDLIQRETGIKIL